MNIQISARISEYFTYHEALWLPRWCRHATSQDGLTDEVLNRFHLLFLKLDQIRDFFNSPIEVHCAYRPHFYNALVGGSQNSAHMAAKELEAAVDFNVLDFDCEQARQMILREGLLEKLNLRMENNGSKAQWIHLDSRIIEPNHQRFFIP